MARRGSTRIVRIMIGLSCVLLFAGYMFWALRAEETFRVVTKKLERTEAGVVVSGEVYNTSASVGSVNVEVSFFNSDGRKVADETIVLENLPAGALAPFHTQPKMFADVRNYSIYLNAGRNMYGN